MTAGLHSYFFDVSNPDYEAKGHWIGSYYDVSRGSNLYLLSAPIVPFFF